MPRIKPQSLLDLKARVSLHDVVSGVVTLKRAGSSWKGLCPFHQEKSPSFHVNAERGFFKCFGCGKSGDMISFVQEHERLEFTEAVEQIARRFSVALEYEEGTGGPRPEERSLRAELRDLHEQATEHYRQAFLSKGPVGDFVRAYWQTQRGFPLELAEEFKIGVAPPDDPGLAALLQKKRYSEPALRQCGLFYRRDDDRQPIGEILRRPRFRGRLMIPIRDQQGTIVAFTARQLEITPPDDPSREAKYVNSPETPLFRKGAVLFNLDRARRHVGQGKPFTLVEGQLDALRCWHCGLPGALAPQGTAVTEEQLMLLKRYDAPIEVFLDGDTAGQTAALRLLPMALKLGLEVRFLPLNRGEDPDSLFRDGGKEAYESRRQGALSAMEFAHRALLPAEGGSPEERSRGVRAILEILSAADSAVTRSGFLSELSALAQLPPAALAQDLEALLRRRARGTAPAKPEAATPAKPAGPEFSAERDLLMLCLHHEELGPALAQAVQPDWIDGGGLEGRLLNRFLAEFEQQAWPGRDRLDGLLETDEERQLVASLAFAPPPIDDPTKVAREGLTSLRRRFLDPKLREIELEIAEKGRNGDDDILLLLKRRLDLQRQSSQPILFSPPS